MSGRVSSIVLDPSDPTGNRVYVGTTGGGVWVSQNAATANTANVQFAPLTDAVGAMSEAFDASISIGAITAQPGGTGVVLAGTGDPNDALDSYYGAGILRSTDGGDSWSLIQATADQQWLFVGEGFAGFAWSTSNPQLVVAAVSQAFEGTLVDSTWPNASYEGLYYSTDSGATWSLARITDGNGSDVQGPNVVFATPDGNAATSVVWNPARNLFIAAVRYHGYYQSTDGVTWTRLSAQPGTRLTTANCPTNTGAIGSLSCPIFRGTLAVNPQTGDAFAWTVDAYNQDQGIWRDSCAMSAGVCSNPALVFGSQINSTALESNDLLQGPATIENGDYNLALAAVPSGQDTLLLAGANDLWKCSLAANCAWRNTTNANSCMSAQVAGYQHALAWSAPNPLEIFVGNDSGLWRSLDAVGETGAACNASDAAHFQNLNGGLGSLAEVASVSQVGQSPDTMMIGLGVNGTAGVKSATGPTADWAQILGGFGGPVAIDPTNASNWYVNSEPGVSIHLCSQTDPCTPADFGAAPVVTNADVSGDGNSMTFPAPFLVDPLDASQLLIGTCRVWRGPANGAGWSAADVISPFLDGSQGSACNGDPLVRTIAAMPLASGSEVIYLGMYGNLDDGGALAGHIFSATFNPNAQAMPTWQDLTGNPVTNDTAALNAFGFDISSIYIDPHDPTGDTVYVTVEGMAQLSANVRVLYRSTDGGAHWQTMTSNLPLSPANSAVVDPQDANTVYLALDSGVYSTRQIGACARLPSNCWSAYGAGLPQSPVTQLSAAPASASLNVLSAGTYGRGVWEIPLWTAGTQSTTATVNPASLTFASQAYGGSSSPQLVTLTNTGGVSLTVSSIATSGDFSESDNCQAAAVGAGQSCAIQVTFAPTQSGTRTGQLTIDANVSNGELSVSLTGTGTNSSGVALLPAAVNFGPIAVGATSSALQVTVQNAMSSPVPVSNVAVTAPFLLSANACGAVLAANSDCQLLIEFTPTQASLANGTLTLVDGAGTQTAVLGGTGAAPPTDTLSSSSLNFQATIVGLNSPAQTISLINAGGLPLTSIALIANGPFQASSNCTTQLAAHSSCTLSVTFDPTAVGMQAGTLTISDALRTQTVTLSGTGIAPPQISVTPAALSFPQQTFGAPSSPQLLTIANTGGASMANVGFQISGLSMTSFSVSASTCGASLSGGSSCTVQVVFTPMDAGGAAATLTVSSSTLGVKAVQVSLAGTGQEIAGINVSPAQITFTVAQLGQASATQTATITNTGAQAANGLALSVSAPFSLLQNACGATLGAGASCSAGVIFTPTVNGAAAGALTITSTTSNSAIVILNGIGGKAGAVQMQPSVVTFTTTGVAMTSNTQTVTLTNTGPVDLAGFALSASNGFKLSNTNCASTLAVGISCTAEIAFIPTSAGPQTGALTASSSSMAASVQATLAGVGFDFGASILGPSSQTVSSGQTASFTIVLNPMSGSSGTFAFQCGSLPANLSCSFNPSNETVAANTTGNATVQIATGQSASRAGHATISDLGVTAICGLLFLPLVLRRKRKLLCMLVGLALLAIGLSSCAGAGGGTGGAAANQQAAANTGAYSIPVSISANGVVHTVTLTLTVD